MAGGVIRKRKRSAVDPCLGYYAERDGTTRIQSAGGALDRDGGSVVFRNATYAQPHPQAPEPTALNGASTLGDTGCPMVVEPNAYISVEDFLKRRAASSARHQHSSVETGKLPTSKSKHTARGDGKSRDRTPLCYAAPKFSPIELEVSPLRPKSAVDWAFDIKAPDSTGTLSGDDAYNAPQSDTDSLPGIAVLECDPSSEESDLPSSGHLNKQTVRLRSRNIRRQQIVADLDDSDESEDPTSQSDSGNLPSPMRILREKKPKKRVKFKSLGSRLFDACVATHGNPKDSLVAPTLDRAANAGTRESDKVHAHRKPLSFNAINAHCTIPGSGFTTIPKKHSLVDPRRSEPFRNAQFGPPMKPHPSTTSQGDVRAIRQTPIVYKTISNWRSKLDENYFQETPSDDQFRGQRKRGRRKEGKAIPEIVYPPLRFVPLSEAQPRRKNPNNHQVPRENQKK